MEDYMQPDSCIFKSQDSPSELDRFAGSPQPVGMWVRTTAIIAVLGAAALTLVSVNPPTRHQLPLQLASLSWDEPEFRVYRVVADDAAVSRPAQKIAPQRDRSKVEAA